MPRNKGNRKQDIEYLIKLAREVGVLVPGETQRNPRELDKLCLRVAKRFNGIYILQGQHEDVVKSINALFMCQLDDENPDEFKSLLNHRYHYPDEISNNFYENIMMHKTEYHGGIPQYLTSEK